MKKLELTNVVFLPLQPNEKFNEFLNMADVHLVLQKADTNDLVMPSKLSTILSVGGLALISASKKSSLHDIISRHKMGILIEPENQSALVDSIRSALTQPFSSIQNNARSFANEYLTIHKVIEKFLDEVMIAKKTLPEVYIIREEKIKADLVSG